MRPYEHYKAGENPFIRVHLHELRLAQKEFVDTMKGPEKLKKELETATRKVGKDSMGCDSESYDISRYDVLKTIINEFEEFPGYANERTKTNCIEYVSREVIIGVLATLNKKFGTANTASNTELVLYHARVRLLEPESIEEEVSTVLNRTIEENDVRNIDEQTIDEVIEKIRQIFEYELTEAD